MIGGLLFIIAYILLLPMTIVNFFVVWDKGYFMSTALSIDIFANREFRSSWNKFLKKPDGYAFGKQGETISSALGKNQRDKTLSTIGVMLCYVLDLIDKDHCQKSINNDIF